jgi:hypothetical protein
MKGLQFLLQSLGVNIDPKQIETAFAQGKDALPKIAAAFDELNSRMQRMEEKLELLLSRTSGEVISDPVQEAALNSMNTSQLIDQFVNGSPELTVRDA